MTKKDWLKDLKNVDDAVMRSSDFMIGEVKNPEIWCVIYALSVAVWHLLLDKVKGDANA